MTRLYRFTLTSGARQVDVIFNHDENYYPLQRGSSLDLEGPYLAIRYRNTKMHRKGAPTDVKGTYELLDSTGYHLPKY